MADVALLTGRSPCMPLRVSLCWHRTNSNVNRQAHPAKFETRVGPALRRCEPPFANESALLSAQSGISDCLAEQIRWPSASAGRVTFFERHFDQKRPARSLAKHLATRTKPQL